MTLNVSDMPFATLLGIEIIDATPERVTASLLVRSELCTTFGIMHGGAIMSFADSLGAIAGYLNLPEDANGTTTIESKTNFLKAANEGTTVIGETLPISVGRRLSVWQTTIRREDDKSVALVTQTQLVL